MYKMYCLAEGWTTLPKRELIYWNYIYIYIYGFKWEDLSLNAGQEIIGMEAGMWEEKKMKERWLKSHEE